MSGDFRDFGGVIDNVTLGRKVDFVNDKNIRGRLIYDATDKLTIDLRGIRARLPARLLLRHRARRRCQ